MKKSLFALFVVLTSTSISSSVTAQTTRNVVVEHFTNTRCGICASRNPGLFTNLESSNDVLHLSIHPSRPYSSCVLNQHNNTENDARTNFYNIYGSTPRVVVQGEVQSAGVDFRSKSLYSDKQNQTSSIEIKLNTIKKGGDSLTVDVVVKSTEAHTLSDMNLFVVAAEDTVFYNAPNGENEHYDVFRKVLLDQPITISSTKGDSMVYRVSVANHKDWDASRMFAMAIVQNSNNKKIEQVASSEGDEDVVKVSVNDLAKNTTRIYPNPFNDYVTIESNEVSNYRYEVLDLTGNVLKTGGFSTKVNVNTSGLPKGIYLISIKNGLTTNVQRLVKH